MDDIKLPIYLGQSRATEVYFFLAPQPENLNRFLRYAGSPMWCASSLVPDILANTEVPESVTEEVTKFISESFVDKKTPNTGKRADPVKVKPTKPALESKKESTDVSNNNIHPGSSSAEPDSNGGKREKAVEGISENYENTRIENSVKEIGSEDGETHSGSGGRLGIKRQRKSVGPDVGNGCPGSDGLPGLPIQSGSEIPESGRRSESPGRVLDTRGSDSGSTAESSPLDFPCSSSVDGLVKPKRKRRTKLEMEAARAAEAAALLAK